MNANILTLFAFRRVKMLRNYNPQNKPFAVVESPHNIGFWNYNLSHHGYYVGVASHADFLVGCDIVDLRTRTKSVKSCAEYVQIFAKQLHPLEEKLVLAQSSEEERYTMFFIIWSLKEAFVKAIGQGLGCDLQRLSFAVQYENGLDSAESSTTSGKKVEDTNPNREISHSEFIYGTAVATWNGQLRSDWSFRFRSLDVCHLFTIALGPLECSIESYSRSAWGTMAYSATSAVKGNSMEALTAIARQPLQLTQRTVSSLLPSDEHMTIKLATAYAPIPPLQTPPLVELNNRGDDASVVFISVEERDASTAAMSPAWSAPVAFSPSIDDNDGLRNPELNGANSTDILNSWSDVDAQTGKKEQKWGGPTGKTDEIREQDSQWHLGASDRLDEQKIENETHSATHTPNLGFGVIQASQTRTHDRADRALELLNASDTLSASENTSSSETNSLPRMGVVARAQLVEKAQPPRAPFGFDINSPAEWRQGDRETVGLNFKVSQEEEDAPGYRLGCNCM